MPFAKPKGESAESLEMMREIDREHTEHPTKGVEGMVDHLLLLGFIAGPKRVRRPVQTWSAAVQDALSAPWPRHNPPQSGLEH